MLYAVQNRFAAPDFVYFLISGEVVIFNVMGGIGTLDWAHRRCRLLPRPARRVLAPVSLDRHDFDMPHLAEFPYLIPVGVIFILMVIFLPQGLLGFAKRWLNR